MIEQLTVHRLDMYTSGLMVFAITAKAHRILSGQFEKRQVIKKYIAVVEGVIQGDSLYGSGNEGEKMILHASFLQFIHPETSKTLQFHYPPPF